MDAIIDLWTKMMEADQLHDEKIVSNVRIMQQQADKAVKMLQENLTKLHAISLTSIVGAGQSSSALVWPCTHWILFEAFAPNLASDFRILQNMKIRCDPFHCCGPCHVVGFRVTLSCCWHL